MLALENQAQTLKQTIEVQVSQELKVERQQLAKQQRELEQTVKAQVRQELAREHLKEFGNLLGQTGATLGKSWTTWTGASLLAVSFLVLGTLAGINLPAGVVCFTQNSPCYWARFRPAREALDQTGRKDLPDSAKRPPP